MGIGRPTEYNEELVAKAYEYLDTGWEEEGHAVPMVVGLCKYINRSRSIVYDWAKDENKAFSDILERLKELQELYVFSRSLKGQYNSTMAKLMLVKHGYTDKVTEEDESPAEPLEININVVDASKNAES